MMGIWVMKHTCVDCWAAVQLLENMLNSNLSAACAAHMACHHKYRAAAALRIVRLPGWRCARLVKDLPLLPHRIGQLVCPAPDAIGLVSKDVSHQQHGSTSRLGRLDNICVKTTWDSTDVQYSH
jgi:hypothetical protein